MAKLDYSKGRLSSQINRQLRESFAKKRAKSRKRNATPAQVSLMKKLQLVVPKNCSVEKACYLIGQVLNKHK